MSLLYFYFLMSFLVLIICLILWIFGSINCLIKSLLPQNWCLHFLFGLVAGLSFSKFFWILTLSVTLMLNLLAKLWIPQVLLFLNGWPRSHQLILSSLPCLLFH